MARSQKQLVAALKKAAVKLGKMRDELQDLHDEAEGFADVSTEAAESLEYAIDRLSELV